MIVSQTSRRPRSNGSWSRARGCRLASSASARATSSVNGARVRWITRPGAGIAVMKPRSRPSRPASPDSSAPRRSRRVRVKTACLVLAVTIDGLP